MEGRKEEAREGEREGEIFRYKLDLNLCIKDIAPKIQILQPVFVTFLKFQ